MKTIMIKDQVYKKLAKLKGSKSFSELLDGMADESRTARMEALEKIRGILTDKEANAMRARIKEMRKNFKVRAFENAP